MKKVKLVNISFVLLAFVTVSCTVLKTPIDRNKIVSNVEIQFVSKKLTFNQNDVFNLSDTGLLSNKLTTGNQGIYWLQSLDINLILKGCKKGYYTTYDILIKSPKYSKPYYGKIAFFDASNQATESAVARYREISIDEQYFASATRGRTAFMYEYAEQKYLNGTKRIPTWFILMSDEPF